VRRLALQHALGAHQGPGARRQQGCLQSIDPHGPGRRSVVAAFERVGRSPATGAGGEALAVLAVLAHGAFARGADARGEREPALPNEA